MRAILIGTTLLVLGFVVGYTVKSNMPQDVVDTQIVIPTGYEQKQAALEDVELQEVFIEEEYQKLFDELSASSDDPYSYIGGRNEAVLRELVSYNDIFPAYRDSSCEIYALQMYMGTGASGIFVSCVHEINKEYIEFLKLVRSMYIDDSVNTNEDALDIQNNISLTVTMLEPRTYGRVLLKDLNPNSNHPYILAEPDEVVIDGRLRYSLMTQDMVVDEIYEVVGFISQPCFDWYSHGEDDEACVAWMYLESVREVVD